jgi:hypothetical protein
MQSVLRRRRASSSSGRAAAAAAAAADSMDIEMQWGGEGRGGGIRIRPKDGKYALDGRRELRRRPHPVTL